MKDEKNDRQSLDQQMRDLRKEIAELSALLALRKLEKEHPHLEKLVNDVSQLRRAFKREAGKIEDYGREHLAELNPSKIATALGSIFLLGSVAYAVLSAFGILGHSKR